MIQHPQPLDARVPDGPFTSSMARDVGISEHTVRVWTAHGLLTHPIRNVYHRADLEDTLDLRVECLRLVVPADAVVTDRTAGWLHGAPRILAPNDHLTVPPANVFCPPGRRLRNGLTASGERSLAATDIVSVNGLLATTPLRNCSPSCRGSGDIAASCSSGNSCLSPTRVRSPRRSRSSGCDGLTWATPTPHQP